MTMTMTTLLNRLSLTALLTCAASAVQAHDIVLEP